MATWCLIKQEQDKFKEALKKKEINPFKLDKMGSEERRSLFEKYVDPENARNINALYESKLLLKNKQKAFESWVEKTVGIKESVKRDLYSKIEKLSTSELDPANLEAYKEDLIRTRLGINIGFEEAKTINKLYQDSSEAKTKWEAELKDHPEWKKDSFKTRKEWKDSKTRYEYGLKQVAIENYVNDLKLESKKIRFREQPVAKIVDLATQIPGTFKSLLASLDNSFFGRQGIKVAMDPKTTGIWVRNFLKSWKDIGLELKGSSAIDLIKADIYSRPNSLNNKYKIGGYGLNVLSEEAFPSTIPEKIPLFKRLYKASESAYNGGALRMRADLADRVIKMAEDNGVNTLIAEQAKPLGKMVSSLTGRGSIGDFEQAGKTLNAWFFSVKFLKANIDTLIAPVKYVAKKATGEFAKQNQGEQFAQKKAAESTIRIIASLSAILAFAKFLDPESVDEDPRSTNFGKIKIYGQWTDITGGMSGLVRLAARLLPTKHDGEWGRWYKNSAGDYKKLNTGEFGSMTGLDMAEDFIEGKVSPIIGILRDNLKGTDFSGKPLTATGVIKGAVIPLPVQNFYQMLKNPNAESVLGSMVLDALGFSVATSIAPNKKTNLIPEGQKLTNDDFIKSVMVYAQAMGVDPETAFNRIFTGQKIRKVSGDAIIVERMPVGESQKVKKKAGADKPEMKLDHSIPLELGGDNSPENLKVVTTSEWESYTKVENTLGKALKDKKINKKEAQDLITKFKAISDTAKRASYGESILKKYQK